jgi:tetratricopeptide (TPR) repeat protein
MRRLLVVALAGLLIGMAACAPKTIPAPVVTSPAFPEYTQPPVPQSFAGSVALALYERAWRFLQANDVRNAEREMAATLKADPSFYPAETAFGYLNLAKRDPKSALPHFDRALELQGSYVSALIGRGDTLIALEREPEAIAAFGAALAVDPLLTDLQRRIEVLRFRGLEKDLAAARAAAKNDRPEEARRSYQAAIARSPESAFLYRELAAVERQAGSGDAALSYFRRAVEFDPSDAHSFAQIGELLEARGDQSGALAAYGQSLALEPNRTVEARRDGLIARAELAKLPEQYRAIDDATQITRGDLAALLGVRLGDLVQSMRSREVPVMTDVRAHWAEPWIRAVTRAGIMEPYENHAFQPYTPVRRADLADAARRLLPQIVSAAQLKVWQGTRATFPDVAAGHLAYAAASLAMASGVMTASADGRFQPSRAVTGAEANETVTRLAAIAGQSARPGSGR